MKKLHKLQCTIFTTSYENKNSFKTGDPANSGLSRTQLKISQSIHC